MSIPSVICSNGDTAM